jgi:predicted Zn-dependent protease
VDQGLYQLASATSQRDRITGTRTLSLKDRPAQIATGNQAAEEAIKKFQASGGINIAVDPTGYLRANSVFQRVHAVSHLRDEHWTLVLTPDPAFNAFVTGGTDLFVNEGLLKEIQSDDELAIVMGHEMAHVAANHVFEREGQLRVSALTHSGTAQRQSFAAAFTYEQEAEADRIGILYASLAGFDPHAASRLWQRMSITQGNYRDTGLYQDHPLSEERAAAMAQAAQQVQQYRVPGKSNPNFAAILENNNLWHTQQTSQIQAGQGGGLLAAMEVAVNAYAAKEKARLEEKRQMLLNQFVANVRAGTSIEGSLLVSPTVFRVQIRYAAGYRLKSLELAALFGLPGQATTQVVTQTGAILVNGSYLVDFTHPEMLRLAPSFQGVSVMNADAF